MGEHSAIQWTDATFNPWIGCQRVSPGCVNCYAEHRNTFVRIQRKNKRELWGPRGDRHVTSPGNWKKPLAWNRLAERGQLPDGTPNPDGHRPRVFCASLADVFEDRRDLDAPRMRLFELIKATPALDWLLLTKRPERVMDLAPLNWRDGFPLNVWMGTSVEDQERAEKRLPALIDIPARTRFLSCEPLLEPVSLIHYLCNRATFGAIHWMIIGGESGDGARPFNLDWALELIRECEMGDVACFVKQLGFYAYTENANLYDLPARQLVAHGDTAAGARIVLTDSHGGDWDEWPDQLRFRAFPAPLIEYTPAVTQAGE